MSHSWTSLFLFITLQSRLHVFVKAIWGPVSDTTWDKLCTKSDQLAALHSAAVTTTGKNTGPWTYTDLGPMFSSTACQLGNTGQVRELTSQHHDPLVCRKATAVLPPGAAARTTRHAHGTHSLLGTAPHSQWATAAIFIIIIISIISPRFSKQSSNLSNLH